MGYYVKIRIKNLIIPAENVKAAHTALKELWTDKPTGWLLKQREATFDGLEDWRGYAWVHYRQGGWPNLVEELQSWPFNAHQCPNGSVKMTSYRGEKWGDQEVLFRALAPFVRGKATIHVIGEEGNEYHYLFDSGAIAREHRNTERQLAWKPLSCWGEGPEREEAIKSREGRKTLGLGW